MTKQELNDVTNWLIENIIENPDIMFSDKVREAGKTFNSENSKTMAIDLISVIVYLHNCIYKEITGDEYNYMFHWANKIGSWVEDEELQESKYIVEE